MADETTTEWEHYGKALIESMAEVLEEAHEEHHPLLLETADYWLSLGLAIALNHPDDGHRILELIEAEESNRNELEADAASFIGEVLR